MTAMRLSLVIALLLGCSASGDDAGARRTPAPPPPEESPLPTDLSIPVTIDGLEASPLTTARLAALPPDFVDRERRAWKMVRLIEGLAAGAEITAVSREGIAVTMRQPGRASDPQPVLFVTRRGEAVATQVDPAQPFPEFHGQGGRLRRPGDSTPRVSPVVRLEVTRPPAASGSPGR